jgi:hypothetical protein
MKTLHHDTLAQVDKSSKKKLRKLGKNFLKGKLTDVNRNGRNGGSKNGH